MLTPTSHAVERQIQREVDFTPEQWNHFARQVFGLRSRLRTNDEALVFSRSLNQGMIIAFRMDRFRDNKLYVQALSQNGIDLAQPQFFIVTVLPVGRSKPRAGTNRIVVESDLTKPMYEQQLIDYLMETTDADPDQNVVEHEGLKMWFHEGRFLALNKEVIYLD